MPCQKGGCNQRTSGLFYGRFFQFVIGHDGHIDPPVLLPSFLGVIQCDGLGLAIALDWEPAGSDLVLGQEKSDRFGALFG